MGPLKKLGKSVSKLKCMSIKREIYLKNSLEPAVEIGLYLIGKGNCNH